MQNCQKFRQIIFPFVVRVSAFLGTRAFKAFSISLLLFIASPNYAVAYGGHGYNYGYGYGHGYGHYGYGHHSYGGHYSHHGHIGTAGYVFLGILGVAILSQILDNDNDRDRHYRKPYSYNQPKPQKPPTQPRHISIDDKSKSKPVYSYRDNEGWDKLAKGNEDYALDIFAIQSQQDLNSGIPKVGFAIAAAANGDTDRATRAMRKAIRVDAAALDKININNIESTIETLSRNYQLILNNNKNNIDNAFMVAVLTYLKQDYATAKDLIAESDKSQSANNLRELIVKKES
jgi:hypothetical protein